MKTKRSKIKRISPTPTLLLFTIAIKSKQKDKIIKSFVRRSSPFVQNRFGIGIWQWNWQIELESIGMTTNRIDLIFD